MYSRIIAGVGGNVVKTIAFVQEIVHIVPLINKGGGCFMPGGEELLEVALGIKYRHLWRIHYILSLQKGINHLDVSLMVGCTGFAVGGANAALFGERIVNHLTVSLVVIHGGFTVGRATLHKLGGWSSPYIVVTFIIIIGFPAVTTSIFSKVKIFAVVPLVTFTIIPGSMFRKGERKKSRDLTTNYGG